MSEKLDPNAVRILSYGMYVVTSRSGDKLNGQIANTVFQTTSDPQRIAVCINKQNLTHKYISESGVFGISVLEESAPMEFIGLFGFRSGKDLDKLSQVKYKIGATGAPLVLDYALSLLEAKVIASLDTGTHTIFLGEMVAGEVLKQGNAMTYSYYHQVKKGKSPKSAPTYVAVGPKESNI